MCALCVEYMLLCMCVCGIMKQISHRVCCFYYDRCYKMRLRQTPFCLNVAAWAGETAVKSPEQQSQRIKLIGRGFLLIGQPIKS